MVRLGTPKVQLLSEVKAVLWRTELLTCGIYANYRWLVSELYAVYPIENFTAVYPIAGETE